jgi:hypothetical protein
VNDLFKDEAPAYDPLNYIRRQMIWDMFQHEDVNRFCDSMGMIRASDDVTELEHVDAHQRERIAELLGPAISLYASLATELIGNALMDEETKEHLPEEYQKQFNQQTFDLIRPAAMAIISQLVVTKQLTVGPEKMVISNE